MPAAPTTPTPAADVPRTPSSAPLAAKDGPAFNVETIDVVPTPTCAASTRTGSPAAALTALGPARREATSAPSPPSAAPRIARRERGAEESADIAGPPKLRNRPARASTASSIDGHDGSVLICLP